MTQDLVAIRFNDALRLALQRRASDIHLSPGRAPVLRIDGELESLPGLALVPIETHMLARQLLDESAQRRLQQDGDASATWDGCDDAVLRVHAFSAMGAVHLAIRLLARRPPSLEELHLPDVVRTFVTKQRGLVLFTGPTGSGKSTSLAALVARINRDYARRIITIEDPIEYRHQPDRSSVLQREIGRDVPSFAQAVIGALRADPDVLVIGEMRDAATMRAALTAAETGHLVLSTLHTGDAIQTIDRILDAFDAAHQPQIRAQLAASLVAVVCQRLLPAAGSGGGRRVVAEVLIANDAVRTTIRESRTHQLRNVMLTGRSAGMQTLESDLNALVTQGLIARTAAEPFAS